MENQFDLVAIRNQAPAEALREMIYAYPTHASDVVHILQYIV